MSTFETIDFDVEDIDDDGKKPDDLASAFVGFFTTLNYKLLLFLFLFFILVNSDIFVDKILSNIEGAVEVREPTAKGTVIQGLILVFFYMIVDLIIKLGFI